eukprot:GHVS01004639.1.p1 GENE.GHVS01004639.1~~GHVS01004639.1.p1  ORF type:complete len:433 (+),score=80.47 GHVS01004639.1:144-1301(+)
MVAPQTTLSWAQYFISDFNLFESCRNFRAVEDAQAASHASIIRAYAEFLIAYSEELLKPFSVLSKLQSIKVVPTIAKQQETGLLLRDITLVDGIVRLSLKAFITDKKFIIPHGFCDITSCTLRHLLKETLKLYGVFSILIMELLDRVERLEPPGEISSALSLYESFLSISEDLLRYCDFMRTLPGIDAETVPSLDMPSLDPLRSLMELYNSSASGGGNGCSANGRLRLQLGRDEQRSSFPSTTGCERFEQFRALRFSSGESKGRKQSTAEINKAIGLAERSSAAVRYDHNDERRGRQQQSNDNDDDSGRAGGGGCLSCLPAKLPPHNYHSYHDDTDEIRKGGKLSDLPRLLTTLGQQRSSSLLVDVVVADRIGRGNSGSEQQQQT